MKLQTPHTLSSIAALLNCPFAGDANLPVLGLNEIHRTAVGDIIFCGHPKYLSKSLNSPASVVLVNDDSLVPPTDKGFIFCPNPFEAYNFLTQHFQPFVPMQAAVSPTATIGQGTVLQPGVVVGNNVSIGNNCLLHPNVVIYDNTLIGNNVIIHANTTIGADAFYYNKNSQGQYVKWHSVGRVVIGNDVEIGANCTIDRGVSADTFIGDGTKLDNKIHIGHDSVIGRNCLFAAQVGIAGVVDIEDDVILWGQVGVSKDLTIGKGAIIMAQSGVGKNVEGGKSYFGSPIGEAREKMRELAAIKWLPEFFSKIHKKDKEQ